MENEEILKACEELFGRFDNTEFETYEGTVGSAFSTECYNTAKGDDFIIKFGKNGDPGSIENEGMSEDLFEFSTAVTAIAFSFGFAMGQMVDPTDPPDRDHINKIQRVIREEPLLPWVPRERGARP
jgi:hypothetical protein